MVPYFECQEFPARVFCDVNVPTLRLLGVSVLLPSDLPDNDIFEGSEASESDMGFSTKV